MQKKSAKECGQRAYMLFTYVKKKIEDNNSLEKDDRSVAHSHKQIKKMRKQKRDFSLLAEWMERLGEIKYG